MKKLLLALALSLLPSLASAQCNGVFQPNTVCGNNSVTAKTPKQIPVTSLSVVAGGSNLQIQYNNAGVLGGLTDTQVTARLNLATQTLKGALPAWPNNTTTFFRGDGTYATLSAQTVTSIDGLFGVFTTNNGVTAAGNVIGLTAARRTLPTFSVATATGNSGGMSAPSSGTYTVPTNTLWLKIRMVGGGGGGGGSGTSGVGSGGSGGNTCLNTSGAACTTPLYQVTGGAGGVGGSVSTNAGGAGGDATGGSANCMISFSGTNGDSTTNPTAAAGVLGGGGGSSVFGGGGPPVITTGVAGKANTGSGGSGGALASTQASGSGGGAGGYCEIIINSPAASYTYAVGAAGTAGTAGTSGVNGGAGAAGVIIIEEHYGS